MGSFLTTVATEEISEQRLATVIPLSHAHERTVNGIASYLLAFDFFEPWADILLQDGILDAFLSLRQFCILPSGQFLVFGKMKTVAVEKPRLIKERGQFGVMM